MTFRIVLPHPLPPIINSPSEASDVFVPGEVEFSSVPDSTVSSIAFALVQTSQFKTHRPGSPTSFICFGLGNGKDLNTGETREIDRWTLSYPPTSVLSSTRRAVRFTVVIPGHLPATTSTPIADISYHISATITTSTATSTASNTTSKPLHIRRLLALPVGLTTLDYRRRYPDCNVPTSLSAPAIFRPLDTCTARLTLLNTAEYWLRVHKVHWRVEECTRTPSPPPPLHHTELEDTFRKHEPNRHVRVIASGERHIAPSEIGALYGSHISELRLDEIDFDITIPEKARLACTLRQDRDALAHDARRRGEEEQQQPPDYAWSSQYQYLTGPPPPQDDDDDDYDDDYDDDDDRGLVRERRRGSVVAAISVSHTLVLEITGKEIRFDGATGEQLSLGPIIPKVYGARYEIMVSEWSHCGDVDSGWFGVSPLSEMDIGAVGPVAPPSYESIIEG